jgi:hypothetical protein
MLRLACLVVISLFAASAYSADPPRYKLPVGRVLYYSGEGSSREKDAKTPASTSKSTWRFTVVAQNPDGSVRVVGRSTNAYSHQGPSPPTRPRRSPATTPPIPKPSNNTVIK